MIIASSKFWKLKHRNSLASDFKNAFFFLLFALQLFALSWFCFVFSSVSLLQLLFCYSSSFD